MNEKMILAKENYRYEIIAIDMHSIKQYLIDEENKEGLKKLEQLSISNLEDIMYEVDEEFSILRIELWEDYLYEVCKKIEEDE
tara:strand:+ start:777 stop:1025 length:249 start_codon:yes stop_codon:yes gene_type:complete